jgi:hypothetical protein
MLAFPGDQNRHERHPIWQVLGITFVEQDGKRVACEVDVFDDSLHDLAEGHYPWDLDSKPNMMINANIEVGRTVC